MENKKPRFILKGNTASLVNHLFQTLLVTYLILLLLEQIWAGFVSTYLDLNYLLVIVIITGILDVFSEHSIIEKKKPKWYDYLFIVVLGILGFAIIKFKTTELDLWLSYTISIIAGILIILLSYLVLSDDEEEKEPKYKSKYLNKFYTIITISSIIIALIILTYVLPFFTSLTYLASLRIVFGSIFVLFLPGFVWTWAFFPEQHGEKSSSIDWLERTALSFALSIAIVPLAVFYLNLIGIKINVLNSSLIILGVIIIGAVVFGVRKYYIKK